ncbi:hypothetical protein [Capnocytophaga cynodegmi]|uniref:Outer membrane protein beta-barrel domain-containing protein n=1 Tax=Capnocytophaga cynodegmi TaxID=28189 RepID=A0A0B7HCH8_9FLAO|nr:hypothetical protein [Capnocytophaga cynodegmi]CEN36041.1 conserved exported hypothetical protein [Capnocytophaga cynodegmi]CEN37416.1 conserved exported hypothetical protein [Capnocytophaga cynodegmi]
MKKIILSLAAIFAFSAVSAQELVSSKGEEYLPKEGDWSFGFNAGNALKFIGNAFNSNTNNEFGGSAFGKNNTAFAVPGFAEGYSFLGKKMTSDNTADRYTANFIFNYLKPKDVDATTTFGLAVGYGKEWRKGSTRLQGFYGADALLGFGVPQKDAFSFAIGAQGFVGAEYFIFPKVALGAQYSYAVAVSHQSSKDAAGNKTSVFGFGFGGENGIGVASLLFNVYF